MLKTRVITALVLMALLLPSIFWLPQSAWALLVAVFIGIGAWEWGSLLGWQSGPRIALGIGTALPDWLMGTSDLDCGFWGHLFNGYSEEYVKEELKPVIARFRNDHSRVTLDGPLLTEQEAAVLRAP